jgi:hypothetical protein
MPILYNEGQLTLWDSFEIAIRRVIGWCEMASAWEQRNDHFWKMFRDSTVKTNKSDYQSKSHSITWQYVKKSINGDHMDNLRKWLRNGYKYKESYIDAWTVYSEQKHQRRWFKKSRLQGWAKIVKKKREGQDSWRTAKPWYDRDRGTVQDIHKQ